jgi:sporulation protein YlmC with PRC-barrel domain
MNLKDPVKLVSQLLDLPIIDKSERWCGIVDDVELEGAAGKEMQVHALLVGPGAYAGRMPAWLFAIVGWMAGDGLVRVPASEVIEIGSVVKLGCTAEELGLHKSEDKARAWIPRWGAM